MLKIGITGGIGSGKTTVCKVFKQLGIPVFYADLAAKLAMTSDPFLVDGVKSVFGAESYHSDGQLNSAHIAAIVFNQQTQLDKLNTLVHPAVFKAFEVWVKMQSSPYVLKEAALLFESGSYQQCDKNILVISPIDLRIARVMDRDQVSEEQVKARMGKQFTDERKREMADYFVSNGPSESIILQVLDLHEKFLMLKQSESRNV